MKVRILVAVFLLPVLFVVAMFVPEVITVIFAAVFCGVGTYELLYRTGLMKHVRLVAYSIIMSFLVPFWSYYGKSYPIALAGILVFYSLIFMEMMISNAKLSFSRACLCFAGGLVVPYMFAALVRILAMDIQRCFILLPIAIAFLADSGAYFVGVFYGKHKLAPVISPKKTVEGLFGGVITAILGTMIFALVIQLVYGLKINYLYAAIYGLVGAFAGVFGDLCFSVIKRQTGIKDYGTIFPGHGGVLDRFDSVIFVAPLVELLLLILPMAA